MWRLDSTCVAHTRTSTIFCCEKMTPTFVASSPPTTHHRNEIRKHTFTHTTRKRPPSLASSLHSNSSGDSAPPERGRLKRELPLSKRKPAAANIHGIKEDGGDDPDDCAQRGPRSGAGIGAGAEPAVVDEVPSRSHHRKLPSWRDTIFNERPHRGRSFDHPRPRDSPADKATPIPTSTDGIAADDDRIAAVPELEPAFSEASEQQAVALQASQVPPTARTPPTASASSASTEFLTVVDAEEEGGRRASGSRKGSVSRRNSGTSSSGGSVVTAADVSARSRATRKAFQMASNGKATAGGRGTRQPYRLPQPIVPPSSQHPPATAAAAGGSSSGSAGGSDAGAGASSSNEGHAPGRPWPPPPPADAVHQVLAGVRLRPAGSSGRPGPKGSIDSSADFLEESDDRRNNGDSGTEGVPQQQHQQLQGKASGSRHRKGRWTASGPLLGRSDSEGGTPANGDVPRGFSGGWRVSGPLTGGGTAERRRGTPRNGWWGRVRVKTPMLVFRSGQSGSSAGSGRASAGNSRNSGGVSALPSGVGGVNVGSGKLSSWRRRCNDCGEPSDECMCNVEEPIGRDGALQRRPSPLRTKSGRLKM